ncbi:hypothetical protein A4A49_65458, partial [Nicotiana attenuata]
WIAGLQHHCPAISSLQTELEALKEGLNVAMAKGFTPLIIETDVTEVIKALQCGCESHDKIVCFCRWLMFQLKQPSIQHNVREGNKVAHKLAKEALNLLKEHLLLERPPPYVINKLETDRTGYIYFIKKLSVVVCCKLANLDNIHVLRTCSISGDVTNN